MSLFNTLTVADVRRETADSVSIAFDVPEALKGDFAFTAGQYLTLKADVGGREVRRSYSICSGPTDGELRVAIRKVEGGLFSTFANDDIGPGDPIDVMKPDGRFVLKPDAAREAHYVCIAPAPASPRSCPSSARRCSANRNPRSRSSMATGPRSP
ncbi:MAG: FAD-binding oxidoreductase [Minwuia sp.]|uniref:FAD-binding oxidoreductase n=1 Tax=Minwuia sp. TaxID=2493630 RepID=UPI003A86BDCF